MTDFDVLVDSDAFVGLFIEHDAHHQTVQARMQRFATERRKLVTTSFVVAESATVISRVKGQVPARKFLTYVRSGVIPVIFIDEALQQASEWVFLSQENKSISMVDCSNVAVMQKFHIPEILSFDQFYFKKHQLQQAA
jgi:predicted nucleic acid-binding protein